MKKLKIILPFNVIFLLLGIFSIIYVVIFTKIIKYESLYSSTDTVLEGKVNNYSVNGNILKMDIKGKELVKAVYYIKTIEEKEYILNNLKLGTDIILNGVFKEPINNTIPNTFNYKRYLYNHKIYYTFTISDYKLENKSNILHNIKDYIQKRIYNMEANEYMLIFMMGDKSLISSEEYSDFQMNGTAHLLAISGMHIGVLVSLLSFLLKRFSDKKRFIIISVFLLFFAFITNFSASVMRVILFFILTNINKFKNWNFSNLHILYFTAIILILVNPFIVYDYGFLYSIIITAGIIYYSDSIKGNYFSKLLKLSIITFLFSLPITASLNYEINIMSILTNLIFVPLVSFIIYPFSLITIIFNNPVWGNLINIFIKLNSLLEKLSIVINIPKLPMILIILYYIGLILIKKNKKYFILLIVMLLFNKLLYKMDNSYYVYFLDVGQGDSTVLISPYQKEIIMIDTGGKIDYAKDEWAISNKKYNLSDNTIKFLKSIGVTKIDYLILSHGDADHMGESINIVNNFKVEKVIFNCGEYNDLENKLIKILHAKNIEYYSCIKVLDINNNRLYFLNTKEYNNENDNSNVVYADFNDFKFLFMGDASSIVEKEILNKYKLSNIDVLKVGHHGSKTSSGKNFINAIDPKYSIISVGKNNRYGHPNKEVLNNLNNSKIYRTDIDGSIMFKIKNNRLKIENYIP